MRKVKARALTSEKVDDTQPQKSLGVLETIIGTNIWEHLKWRSASF